MLNESQNYATDVSVTELSEGANIIKKSNKPQEQSSESCEEGGSFPSHKIPQGKD